MKVTNYPYLAGQLETRLKWVASDLVRAGLIDPKQAEQAQAICVREIEKSYEASFQFEVEQYSNKARAR